MKIKPSFLHSWNVLGVALCILMSWAFSLEGASKVPRGVRISTEKNLGDFFKNRDGQRKKKGKIPQETVIAWMLPVVSYLEALEKKEKVDGRLNPERLAFTIKKEDLEVVKKPDDLYEKDSPQMDSYYTAYSAPEQNDTTQLFNSSMDVRAFGAIFYKVMTDQEPIFDSTVEISLKKNVPPDLYSESLVQLVGRCLSDVPSQRPSVQSIREGLKLIERTSNILWGKKSTILKKRPVPPVPRRMVLQEVKVAAKVEIQKVEIQKVETLKDFLDQNKKPLSEALVQKWMEDVLTFLDNTHNERGYYVMGATLRPDLLKFDESGALFVNYKKNSSDELAQEETLQSRQKADVQRIIRQFFKIITGAVFLLEGKQEEIEKSGKKQVQMVQDAGMSEGFAHFLVNRAKGESTANQALKKLRRLKTLQRKQVS